MVVEHLKHSSTTGHLVHNASGHLVQACPSSAPCVCPSGLANAYAMMPGVLSACSSCSGGSCSTSEAWDGTFQELSSCRWIAQNSAYSIPPVGVCFHLEGKNLSTAEITLNTTLCQWEILIKCFASPSHLTIWSGTKTVGQTPAGTYIKTAGCAGVGSLVVV